MLIDLNLQSFNLVTQADSRIMKADSNSMKTIAAMTLGFLPCTAVAVSCACRCTLEPSKLILL